MQWSYFDLKVYVIRFKEIIAIFEPILIVAFLLFIIKTIFWTSEFYPAKYFHFVSLFLLSINLISPIQADY